MTAPIDIECPHCKETAGNYCTSEAVSPTFRQKLAFYHAERVDEAFRANTRRQHDPRALREALREALARLKKRLPADVLARQVIEQDPERAVRDRDELSFIVTTREVFGL